MPFDARFPLAASVPGAGFPLAPVARAFGANTTDYIDYGSDLPDTADLTVAALIRYDVPTGNPPISGRILSRFTSTPSNKGWEVSAYQVGGRYGFSINRRSTTGTGRAYYFTGWDKSLLNGWMWVVATWAESAARHPTTNTGTCADLYVAPYGGVLTRAPVANPTEASSGLGSAAGVAIRAGANSVGAGAAHRAAAHAVLGRALALEELQQFIDDPLAWRPECLGFWRPGATLGAPRNEAPGAGSGGAATFGGAASAVVGGVSNDALLGSRAAPPELDAWAGALWVTTPPVTGGLLLRRRRAAA